MPSYIARSGTTSPWTRSRETPPSGKMFSRTWVNLRPSPTANSCAASPPRGLFGTISTQSASWSSATEG